MAAAQTKGHEKDEQTGMQEKIIRKEGKEKRKKKNRKQGTKASKQGNRTQGVSHSNKFSRLCYKAEMGTLPHHLPAIFFLLSSATVVTAAAVEPPPGEQINENQTKLAGLGGCSNSGSTYY